MGRPQIPVERKLAKGRISSAEAKRLLAQMPPRIEGMPEPPDWLSDYALVGWHRFCHILMARGQLSQETETALAAMAACYGEWVKLAKDVQEHGHTQVVVSDKGVKAERIRPNANAFSDADRRLRGWLTEFGLTDASRGKINAGDTGAAEDDDPLSRYGLN